jgi:GTP-binding protein HflX
VTQKRSGFDSAAYLGPGRLADLATMVKSRDVPTVVLLDHEVSPSQARQVQKTTGAHSVLDRTAVILEIFHRHARSRQAKAQVELVRLQYMAPRLRETKKLGDRQRGGIGGKGAGESAMELDRRKLRDRIAQLRDEIDALAAEHRTRSARRQGLRRVALCGYTNAGKSTLFRALTGSEVYIADKLFATLDTTVRQLHPEPKNKILVSDTIGFIRNLPTKLVASFKTTLDEALEANLILHVVDSADPACERHIETTNSVLSEIGAGDVPQLVVFNKVDKLEGGEVPEALRQRFPEHIALSAKRPEDVARLHARIVDFFNRDLVEVELLVPYDRQAQRGPIFAVAEVLDESHDEAGTRLRVRIDPIALKQLAREVHVLGPTKNA